MPRSNVALRIAMPAPDSESDGVDVPRVTMIPVAESAGPVVANQPAHPAAGDKTRYAPGAPTARIFQRGRSPMQSAQARESIWLLTFEPRYRTEIDFLMGWTSSRDTLQQVELRFLTLGEAIAFAKRRGLHYVVETPRRREIQPKSYADNFRHDRLLPWTH